MHVFKAQGATNVQWIWGPSANLFGPKQPDDTTWRYFPNSTVTTYEILRDGVIVGTSTTTGYVDSAAPQGQHVYQLDALDALFQRSPRSAPLTVTKP